MIELPGSFSGIVISPMPQRGPEASQRTSLAILMSDAASVLSAPCACTSASLAASASNLLGAVTNGMPGQLARARAATRTAYSGCALSPVPTAVPPSASSRRWGSDASRCVEAVVELRDVARELLAERQRRRVLQVGAADLDDVAKGLRLVRAARRAAARTVGMHLVDAAPPPRPRSWRWGRRRSTTGPCSRRRSGARGAARRARRRGSRWPGWRAPRSCSCWSACRCPSARRRAGTRRRAGRRAPRRRR